MHTILPHGTCTMAHAEGRSFAEAPSSICSTIRGPAFGLLPLRRRNLRAQGLLDGLISKMQGGQGRHTAPEFVPIDVDSDGGLGGTSEQLFGPLVLPEKFPRLVQSCSIRVRISLVLKCLALQAVALLGYSQGELDTFRAFMIDMDADMVKASTPSPT